MRSRLRIALWLKITLLGVHSAFIVIAFAVAYQPYDFIGGEETERFARAFYFSVITWTSVGYGDIHPIGPERILTVIQALAGYVYLGVFVGLVIEAVRR